MSVREFYKTHYALEVARKTNLTAALSLPVGVVSGIAGALVIMAKEAHAPLSVGDLVELGAIALSAIACSLSGYFLFRSLYNFTYGYTPTPLQLKKYKDQLAAFHASAGRPQAEANELAEAETLDYIDTEYAKNADRNAKNNDIKSSYLHRANGAMIAAVGFGAVAGVVYVFNSVSSPRSIQKVELVNFQEHPAMAGKPPAPQPPPAKRPEPPPSRLIKEGNVAPEAPPTPPPPAPTPTPLKK